MADGPFVVWPGLRGWLVICFHRCHYLHSLRRWLLHGFDRCSTLLHVWVHCLSARFCFSIVQLAELSSGIDKRHCWCRLLLLHSLQCRKVQQISRCVKTTQGKNSKKKRLVAPRWSIVSWNCSQYSKFIFHGDHTECTIEDLSHKNQQVFNFTALLKGCCRGFFLHCVFKRTIWPIRYSAILVHRKITVALLLIAHLL